MPSGLAAFHDHLSATRDRQVPKRPDHRSRRLDINRLIRKMTMNHAVAGMCLDRHTSIDRRDHELHGSRWSRACPNRNRRLAAELVIGQDRPHFGGVRISNPRHIGCAAGSKFPVNHLDLPFDFDRVPFHRHAQKQRPGRKLLSRLDGQLAAGLRTQQFNRDRPRPRHYLYRNLGGLKFEDVTEKTGLAHTGWGQGVCAGDVDNDGATDLMVSHWGQNALFRNQGDGSFRNEAKERGLTNPKRRWSTGCAFLDYDRDGDLDLFVAHYVDFDLEETPKPGDAAECRWKEIPVVCGPRGLPGESMSLYRNDGHGVFADVSQKAGVSGRKQFYGLAVLTADFDDDGWTDVYVACDSTPSLLYRNRTDGTFEEVGAMSGTAYSMDGLEQAGMGAAAADFDGDGKLDIFKTNFIDDSNTLYRNDGEGMFLDETLSSGLGVHTEFLGWGTAFVDFDQDGWKDLVVVNGHVYAAVDQANINEKFKQSRLLYWNRRDGAFLDLSREAGPAIVEAHSSRGLALGDFDNDGALEVVIVNMHEAPSLLKNFGEKGNSLLVRALTASGRDAIGARITVTGGGLTRTDEVRSGDHYMSQSDFRLHFGLASITEADIRIRWPDGETQTFQKMAANRSVVVQQGKGLIETHEFSGAPH